jgi:hypothetical protein
MLWFFQKHHAHLHYEIRRQSDGLNYELVITFPDGRQEVERFPDAEAVVERSMELQHTLTKAGWQPPRAQRSLRLS